MKFHTGSIVRACNDVFVRQEVDVDVDVDRFLRRCIHYFTLQMAKRGIEEIEELGTLDFTRVLALAEGLTEEEQIIGSQFNAYVDVLNE